MRLRFSEGGEERATVFKENQTVFRGDSGLLFSKEISPCFRGIRGCCFQRRSVHVLKRLEAVVGERSVHVLEGLEAAVWAKINPCFEKILGAADFFSPLGCQFFITGLFIHHSINSTPQLVRSHSSFTAPATHYQVALVSSQPAR